MCAQQNPILMKRKKNKAQRFDPLAAASDSDLRKKLAELAEKKSEFEHNHAKYSAEQLRNLNAIIDELEATLLMRKIKSELASCRKSVQGANYAAALKASGQMEHFCTRDNLSKCEDHTLDKLFRVLDTFIGELTKIPAVGAPAEELSMLKDSLERVMNIINSILDTHDAALDGEAKEEKKLEKKQ